MDQTSIGYLHLDYLGHLRFVMSKMHTSSFFHVSFSGTDTAIPLVPHTKTHFSLHSFYHHSPPCLLPSPTTDQSDIFSFCYIHKLLVQPLAMTLWMPIAASCQVPTMYVLHSHRDGSVTVLIFTGSYKVEFMFLLKGYELIRELACSSSPALPCLPP